MMAGTQLDCVHGYHKGPEQVENIHEREYFMQSILAGRGNHEIFLLLNISWSMVVVLSY